MMMMMMMMIIIIIIIIIDEKFNLRHVCGSGEEHIGFWWGNVTE
jgi:hypothetical protein